jgi:hypothetical protein
MHCQSGRGISCTLIALWYIVHHGWPADHAVGWLRIVRSGCVYAEQHAFLRTLDNGGFERLFVVEERRDVFAMLMSREYTACPRGGRYAWRRLKGVNKPRRHEHDGLSRYYYVCVYVCVCAYMHSEQAEEA